MEYGSGDDSFSFDFYPNQIIFDLVKNHRRPFGSKSIRK